MKFYTLTTIILISFALNGCIIDRIKQRMFAKKQIEKQEQAIEKKNRKVTQRETVPRKSATRQNASKSKKVYKPSKVTAPIYSKPEEVKVEPVVEHRYKKTAHTVKTSTKSVKKKYTKKKKHISNKKHVAKKVKIKPEPYSIEKDEQDPELLGPQTTMDSNPLTHNTKASDSKKKKI